ncbi:cytosine deaminase [Quadrisphaera granulorum]|uniref:Cytosine deaminase n=1 Tax=Quadrisphaera granulorum TaxID=317664 RepID=A0A316A8M9_9ACTN|nr:amidohydrolase family protein [Quadrisphaera granulorum]PWJ53993.1 cytosine deaminase [Quadrisphaera granulorum]SZE96450.1 cytosine deaminase [Quadrisphaera granulorum]
MHAELLAPGHRISSLTGLTPAGDVGETLCFSQGSVAAEAETDPSGLTVDATDWVALPPLADLHAHLDKDYTWTAFGEPEGPLEDAIACWAEHGEHHTYRAIKAGARRHLLAALHSGVTAVRSHTNFHLGDDPLRGVRALAELRTEFAGVVDLQVVMAPGPWDGPDDLGRAGIPLGPDLIGGFPHLADDPAADLERCAAFAEEFGLGIDLHTDETLDASSVGLLQLAERTRHWPAGRIRSAGHCVSLSTQDDATRARTLAAVAAAGVSIITNPLTNLYLQGWQHPVATPRGIPPLREIMEAGVTLAAGGDNVQDPFNPLGNADMVDVACELVTAGHLTPAEAWHVSSHGGRATFGLPPARGLVGDVADVVLVRAAHTAEALAERAPDRVVIRAGRVVAVRRRVVSSVLDPHSPSDPSSVPTAEGAMQ